MSAPQTETKQYSYDDYLLMPDEQRYELVETEIVMTPSPIPYHQLISENIGYELARFGVKEYWIVDPGEKSVEVYGLQIGEFVLRGTYTVSVPLVSPLLAGLRIDLSTVF